MSASIIVRGPMACGKTRNADRLRRHFGLSRVVDDWHSTMRAPKTGTLILTNDASIDIAERTELRVVEYADAARQAGCAK